VTPYLEKYPTQIGVVGVVQVVEHLPSMPEALNSSPSAAIYIYKTLLKGHIEKSLKI
jgi:hypothetical protein